MAAEKKTSPNVESRLRHNILKMPQEVYAASGIVINGRRLKSFVFTTDLAIIRNCDADAVFAVYPFTPQPVITAAIASNEKRKMKNEKLSRNLRILLILNF